MTRPKRTGIFVPVALLHIALIASITVAAAAADLPDYYPKEGLGRIAIIDEYIADEQRIILNDISYTLADNVIVHTPASFSAPKSAMKAGDRIAFRLGGGRLIVEIWIVPADYAERRQR